MPKWGGAHQYRVDCLGTRKFDLHCNPKSNPKGCEVTSDTTYIYLHHPSVLVAQLDCTGIVRAGGADLPGARLAHAKRNYVLLNYHVRLGVHRCALFVIQMVDISEAELFLCAVIRRVLFRCLSYSGLHFLSSSNYCHRGDWKTPTKTYIRLQES
jgi:hypothetical protein